MSIETADVINMRVTIERPIVTRESLRDALNCLLGKPINADTLAEAQRIVATVMKPIITVEPITGSSLLIHLPLYQHISAGRQVRALKIAAVIPNPRGIELHFENTRYTPIQVSNRWHIDWAPEAGGYYGQAENGEPFYLEQSAFEHAYTMVEVGA